MTLPQSDSYSTYGGEIIDYSLVEDPNTDLAADASNQLRASAAAMSATCFRVVVIIHTDTVSVFLDDIKAVWDINATADPILSYLAAGIYRISFPSTVVDVRGNIQNLNLLGGIANIDISNVTKGFFATVNKVDPITFDVYLSSAIDGMLEDSVAPIMVCIR